MKNTFTYLSTRTFPKAIGFFLLLAFLFIAKLNSAQAQTINFVLVKAPCHNDGILVIQTTGITPPVIFGISQGNGVYTQDTINGSNDTLKNYDGGFINMDARSVSGIGGMQGFYNGAPPFLFSIERGPAVCPKLGYAKAIIDSGGTAPFQVQWYNPGSTSVVATGDSVGLPPGYYNILITDAHGCTYGSYAAYDSLYIYSISPIHFNSAVTTANCTNGSATLSNPNGGTAPYTYHWSNGANAPSISNLITGDYAFTVTDAQGCVNDSDIVVPQSVNIEAMTTATNATCVQSDGSDIAFGSGGNTPYTYLWNNGQSTQSISNLVSGYYSVTVTDARGCIGSKGYSYVAASTPITVTYSATASSCTSATGTATVNIAGGTAPYTISWNTFPVQTSTTATGLAPGVYGFQITDAVKCVQSGSVYVPPISVISAYAFASDAQCTQSNGEANIVVITGTPPYTYQWSNGTTDASIAGLPSGGYSCKITDNLGCSVNKYANVGRSSPIGLSLSTIQSSCLYSNDGSAKVLPYGGTAPYTYGWSNGQTTATSTGLTQGNYYAYVSDAAGCVQNGFTYVGYDASNNSCYCTISGTVYEDDNSDCIQNNGEPGIQNIMVHLSGFGYTYTDQNGNYSFLAPTGSYTLSEDVEYYYPLASCQNNNIAVNVTAGTNCTSINNFANVINPIHDLSIYTCSYYNPPIPGNVYEQYVVIKNNGTITENNILSTYKDDGQLSTPVFYPASFTSVASNYYSNIPASISLTPGAEQVLTVDYNVATNIPLGTQVNFNDTAVYQTPISNWLSDYSPWNNVNAYQNAVVGSFDPNYKEVTPVGAGIQGYIHNTDSILTYTIHFQNTGSYPAQKIVVVDTLDSHLDFTTLRPGYSNHAYSTKISENGVLTFTFNNINLPDSSVSKQASIGIVAYSIRQKKSNTAGIQIKSPASIYFDYNAPVRTNTPLNTLQGNTGIKENTASVLDLTVYPNPASTGSVNLLINTNTASSNSTVGVYDLLGKLVQTKTVTLNVGKNIITEDINKLSPGLYFVRVDDGQKSLIQKLTIVK